MAGASASSSPRSAYCIIPRCRKVHPTSQVKGWDKIVRDCWAIPERHRLLGIQAINGIEMGKNIIIGPGVAIVSANHDLNDFTKHEPANRSRRR